MQTLLLSAVGDLVQVMNSLALRKSDSGMKWRHSSRSQSFLPWVWQNSTFLPRQQTVQTTPAWYLILSNQKNSLRIHSSIKRSCLKTDWAQGTSQESLTPWTTTSMNEEWHKRTTEHWSSLAVNNLAKFWYNWGFIGLQNPSLPHKRNWVTSRGNRRDGTCPDSNLIKREGRRAEAINLVMCCGGCDLNMDGTKYFLLDNSSDAGQETTQRRHG